MKIKWLAHASFLITADNGTRIITDPYEVGDKIQFGKIDEAADIVTVSHDHFDHNNVAAVRGNPTVVRETTEVKGIKFRAIPTAHDDSGGSKRGKNTAYCFEVNGIKICHVGDLGHTMDKTQTAEIGSVDVLIIPVGGFYTIDAKTASTVCDQLKPRVIIPMHFKTKGCGLSIAPVDEFLQGKPDVTQLDSSELELKAGELPTTTRIIVLKPAL